jgi:hypothetical protein
MVLQPRVVQQRWMGAGILAVLRHQLPCTSCGSVAGACVRQPPQPPVNVMAGLDDRDGVAGRLRRAQTVCSDELCCTVTVNSSTICLWSVEISDSAPESWSEG